MENYGVGFSVFRKEGTIASHKTFMYSKHKLGFSFPSLREII